MRPKPISTPAAGETDMFRKLHRVKQFLAQKPDDKNKIYALHAPEVECIAKGKARALRVRREGLDRGHQRAGRWRPVHSGHSRAPGLPYDGHTSKDQIAQVERLTGVRVARAYVDKGYRGHALRRPISTFRRAPAIELRPLNGSCGDAAPSNRSSVTPRATVFSNEIASPAPKATPSTRSWWAPATTSACSWHG
jgi:hypothetical protein